MTTPLTKPFYIVRQVSYNQYTVDIRTLQKTYSERIGYLSREQFSFWGKDVRASANGMKWIRLEDHSSSVKDGVREVVREWERSGYIA